MAERPPRIDLSGIVLLDKPLEMSSNRALQKVKGMLRARKAGHTGSLDPLATGLLPICLGEATKFCQFLLDADKCYRAVAKLGQTTVTGDREGDVLQQRAVPALTEDGIKQLLQQFMGETTQVPSMYSALKHEGKPLYHYARRGIDIPRQGRLIRVDRLELLEFTEDTITIEVQCSKGTYIRNLVEDIGVAMGCGAHVHTLRRIKVAGFDESSHMYSLDAMQQLVDQQSEDLKQCILPVDMALSHIPTLQVDEAHAVRLHQGQKIPLQMPSNQLVRVYSGQHFIGLAQSNEHGSLAAKRMLSKPFDLV